MGPGPVSRTILAVVAAAILIAVVLAVLDLKG